MKYTIEGFSQQQLIEWRLDCVDAVILRYIVDFYVTGKMVKVQVEGVDFFWIKYSAVLDQLPIAGITSKRVLSRRFDKYVACGLMGKSVRKDAGNYTFFRFTSEYEKLVAKVQGSTQKYIGSVPGSTKGTHSKGRTKDSSSKNKSSKTIYISVGGNGSKKIPIEEAAENLIKYLNDRTGRDFEYTSDVAVRELKGRANDGRTAAEIGAVIAFKCDQWIGTEWEGFLQPSTLFRKSKFDEYLVAMRYKVKEERGIRKNDGRKTEEGLNSLQGRGDETDNAKDNHGVSA